MRYFLVLLVIILILGIIFKFLGFIMFLLLKFWFIALPLGVFLYFNSRKEVKVVKSDKGEKLDPSNEVKLDQDPKVEDE